MSNQPAAEAIVPVTNAGQVVTTKRDTWQRFGRTGLQLVAGGALTGIVDLIVGDVPGGAIPYVYGISTLLVTWAQNECEARGWIPIVLKKPPVVA